MAKESSRKRHKHKHKKHKHKHKKHKKRKTRDISEERQRRSGKKRRRRSSSSSSSEEVQCKRLKGAKSPVLTVVSGAADAISARPYMEDRNVVQVLSSRFDYTGVYDGHGGAEAADFCEERLHVALSQRLKAGDGDEEVREKLIATFLETENAFLETRLRCGTTVVVSLVDLVNRRLWTAHVGDSRAVMCRSGKALRLTSDHKPDLPEESKYILSAGGDVVFMGCWRVTHPDASMALACSRSIGDRPLKECNVVSAVPDISRFDLTSRDEFVVVASDGLWDVMSDSAAVALVRSTLALTSAGSLQERAQLAAEKLVAASENAMSEDNITATVTLMCWE